MRKLIFRNNLSAGDIVMLTAAVRDLHRWYPGRFLTDVRTRFPEIWQNNPYLTPLNPDENDVEAIDCECRLVDRSNQGPFHALHGYIDFLNGKLGLQITLTEFKGDIHLSASEKSWRSPMLDIAGTDLPFWIVVAGGKYDITIKWWDTPRYQEVIDHYRGKIQFVQVGQVGHHHPGLQGTIDVRGKTNLRQLIRLVYHSQGVLCGVTAVMHLAAALEVNGKKRAFRPCVVVAGGREPIHWEAYPGHQFIHTIGALPCCATGGCWKSRTLPLGDGDLGDKKKNLCVDVRGHLPRCMEMITADEVIRRIDTYFKGGTAKYLTAPQAKAALRGVAATRSEGFEQALLTVHTVRNVSERFIKAIPSYPGHFQGCGIVICGGGLKCFTNAWVCIHMLRQFGCSLPIQLWHLGESEFDERMRSLVAPLGVVCIDALERRGRYPCRILNGWSLKPYAIIHCPFKEVLLLDADNVPVVNPEFLFDSRQFRKTGAIFWPDMDWGNPPRRVWGFCGIPYRKEAPCESGQILVDKERCWKALALSMWYNEHADFFYQHIHGDKETYHLAFRKLRKSFSIPRTPVLPMGGGLCQHDFAGNRIFQHRTLDKWTILFRNRPIRGFWHEKECRGYLEQLRQQWDGRIEYYQPFRDAKSGSILPRLGRNRPQKIRAFMVSCRERDSLRVQTLENLSKTDWGGQAVFVQIDEARVEDRIRRITQTAFLALSKSLETDADYILYLEDDLQFNRFLLHNLRVWEPVRRNAVTLASLYNPSRDGLAFDAKNNFVIVDPKRLLGNQALLISRATIKFMVDHWGEIEAPLDTKLGCLAERSQRPVFYHNPSLVQHVGSRSLLGGHFHQAQDFDPLWKAV